MIAPAPTRRSALGWRGLTSAAWRLALASAILALAVLLLLGLASIPRLLFDYRGDLYNAATAILHGHSPYRPGYLAHLALLRHQTGAVNPAFAVPVYPAPVLVAAVPLGLLPVWLGGALFIALSAVGLVCGLRLLGVHDWRCIALALISWPVLFGLWFGTLSPVLVLGAGILWRARERMWSGAASLAVMVLAKVFPWPLMLWPLLRRRWRTFGLALALTALASLAAWALIGWHSLISYPHMLHNLSYVEQDAGISLTTTLISLGVAARAAELLALAGAGLLVVMAWRVKDRERGPASAFGLLVMAALTASPLVWVHYEVLLFVPIALLAPRLSPLWFLPVISGLIPVPHFHDALPMLMWPAMEGVIVVALWRAPTRSTQPSRQLAAAAADAA